MGKQARLVVGKDHRGPGALPSVEVTFELGGVQDVESARRVAQHLYQIRQLGRPPFLRRIAPTLLIGETAADREADCRWSAYPLYPEPENS